jgi:hypothetical protein
MCAMAAATGATGARTWLQNSHATWLTPRRMKVATVGVMSAAFAVSTVGLSGSTPPSHHSTAHSSQAVRYVPGQIAHRSLRSLPDGDR